jgi:hypothetical protein
MSLQERLRAVKREMEKQLLQKRQEAARAALEELKRGN